MPIFAELPDSSTAPTASSAYWPPRVSTPSMEGSACSFDFSGAFTSASLVPSTWRFAIWPENALAAEEQRSSRPTLPASWITQSAFFRPASPRRLPTASPATVSLWPMWVRAPNSADRSIPELMVTTGMPAATAFSTLSFTPSGFAIEPTIPSTSCATALSMSWDCLAGSGSELYVTVAPYWPPAVSAPDFTRSQKASPVLECVTTANVRSPPPFAPPAVGAASWPVPAHVVRRNAAATVRPRGARNLFFIECSLSGGRPRGGPGRRRRGDLRPARRCLSTHADKTDPCRDPPSSCRRSRTIRPSSVPPARALPRARRGPTASGAVGRVGACMRRAQSETGTGTRSRAERCAASASTSAARPSAKVGLSDASPRARRMKARSSATYAAA